MILQVELVPDDFSISNKQIVRRASSNSDFIGEIDPRQFVVLSVSERHRFVEFQIVATVAQSDSPRQVVPHLILECVNHIGVRGHILSA